MQPDRISSAIAHLAPMYTSLPWGDGVGDEGDGDEEDGDEDDCDHYTPHYTVRCFQQG